MPSRLQIQTYILENRVSSFLSVCKQGDRDGNCYSHINNLQVMEKKLRNLKMWFMCEDKGTPTLQFFAHTPLFYISCCLSSFNKILHYSQHLVRARKISLLSVFALYHYHYLCLFIKPGCLVQDSCTWFCFWWKNWIYYVLSRLVQVLVHQQPLYSV